MKTLICHRRVYSDERGWFDCCGTMPQTNWKPDDSRDPQLRQYQCNRCGYIEYLVDDNSYLRKFGVKR